MGIQRRESSSSKSDAPDATHSTRTRKDRDCEACTAERAGTVADFSYSDELKASQIMWDEQSLDRWLINPDAMVTNNDMAFHVSNPQERADIIQFLRLSSGK